MEGLTKPMKQLSVWAAADTGTLPFRPTPWVLSYYVLNRCDIGKCSLGIGIHVL